jgi:acyl-CoA thioesterase-2
MSELDLSHIFDLEPHGPDTYLGESPQYPWGRIYGGLVVAQALWSATQTVQVEHHVHSLHAYFILGGELGEPVRYEVDRVRNGRSFSTRRVVARQSGGAILTLECSFQVHEPGPDSQSAPFPKVPHPDALKPLIDAGLDVRTVPGLRSPPGATVWTHMPIPLGDDARLHACALAYLSDVDAIGAIAASYPGPLPPHGAWNEAFMSASLDHSLWFHRFVSADDWLLLDMSGQGIIGSRGLATGLIFSATGTHVATLAQEGLMRLRRASR